MTYRCQDHYVMLFVRKRGFKMEEKLCQCCGMPMGKENELCGKHADRTQNDEYCMYCYENGQFTFDGTMEEMIDICVPHVLSVQEHSKEEDIRNEMLQFFPTLKRWKQSK